MDRILTGVPVPSPPRRSAVVAGEQVALVDLLDRLLAGGVVITGDITISIANVDLVRISLRAIIASIRPEMDRIRDETSLAAPLREDTAPLREDTDAVYGDADEVAAAEDTRNARPAEEGYVASAGARRRAARSRREPPP